jgi:L-alanine-DL-glutamate epimerase-like enolase superfamily enzyme
MRPVRIVELEVTPLSVPLREPFVIASATMSHTRAALVRVVAEADGRRVEGLGEAAALWPVTPEDQPDMLATLKGVALVGCEIATIEDVAACLPRAGLASRAGLECALLDALARARGLRLCALLGDGTAELVTDITLPIGEPSHLAKLARGYAAQGFTSLKIKVGRDLEADMHTLTAVQRAVPDVGVRLDANEGYDAAGALALLAHAARIGVTVECFEQPCRTLDDMSAVRAACDVPVVADESVKTLEDLQAVIEAQAADAVNLKLAKMGGIVAAKHIAAAARANGLSLMAGAMVETRLGLCAMAHLVTAIGGVSWLDLDTAMLLAADPFSGGYVQDGPRMQLGDAPGVGCSIHARWDWRS